MGTIFIVLLVPTHYLELIVGPDWAVVLGEQVRFVRVGKRVEADVASCSEELRDQLQAYVQVNRLVGGALASAAPIGPFVVVRRHLSSVVQQAGTRSASRGDLVSELEALRGLSETSLVAEALLASTVDEEALRAMAVDVVRDGVKTSVEVRVEGWREWPEALGGGAFANEIERVFVLGANHAGWRDRMVRRLTRLDVYGVELLADPRVVCGHEPLVEQSTVNRKFSNVPQFQATGASSPNNTYPGL